MGDQRGGGISWTDSTLNVVRGCSRVSAGCANCYAERDAIRSSAPGKAYHGLVKSTDQGPRWTGKVVLVRELLDVPKNWKRPRLIFVNAMSDIFHESLVDADIFAVFQAMARAPQHKFQVLTKRSKRMRELYPRIRGHLVDRLEHVWMGVSVEHQDAADERIPDLLATPASVRWLSVEPQIGPVVLQHEYGLRAHADVPESLIDWMVVGGESGPSGARRFDLQWARALKHQARAMRIQFHFKQTGNVLARELGYASWKGDDPSEWPQDLQVQEYPRGFSK